MKWFSQEKKRKTKTGSLFMRSAWGSVTFNLWVKQHSCTVWLTIDLWAARHQLPQHQAHGVHVYPQEGVPLEVDGSLQHLWSHVTPRTHLAGQWIQALLNTYEHVHEWLFLKGPRAVKLICAFHKNMSTTAGIWLHQVSHAVMLTGCIPRGLCFVFCFVSHILKLLYLLATRKS